MKRILITRPEPDATDTATRVAALGLCPIVAPMLSVITGDTHAPDHVAATLLTSRNAVSACPVSLHERPVFAVGPATATRAREAGFRNVFDANGDAQALTEMVTGKISPADGTLFLPVGRGQGRELATSLRTRGFSVIRRVAYRAAGVRDLPESVAIHLREGKLAAAMFFSGETSRHFVRLLLAAGLADAVRGIEAVSISERAAVALRSLPWRRISVAAKPNQDAMLVLLK